MKNSILILILGIFSVQGIAKNIQHEYSVSSDTLKLKYNSIDFIGTWVSKVATNDTVEITLVKKVMYAKKMNQYFEAIVGSVKRIKNGHIVFYREIKENNIVEESGIPLVGGAYRPDELIFTYWEGEQSNNNGLAYLTRKDSNNAIWILKSTREKQGLDKFQIPGLLNFTRK